MIRRTSETVSMRKLGQMGNWWQKMLPAAGALAGGAGGYIAHNKATGGEGSWGGSLASTVGGGALGMAAGGARFPWSAGALRAIHDIGQSGGIPLGLGLGGAVAGGVHGYQNANTYGLGDSPWAAAALGTGLGGMAGTTLGHGIGSAASRFAGNKARDLARDTFGEGLARDWRNSLQNSAAGQTIPGRFQNFLNQDTQNLTGRMAVHDAISRSDLDDVFAALQIGGATGGSGLAARFGHNWLDPNRAMQAARGAGFDPSIMGDIKHLINTNAGPNAWNYLRGGALLGGGYLGAGAAADLYNRFRRPQDDEDQRRRRGVIVL
jgi:hypothetical protein